MNSIPFPYVEKKRYYQDRPQESFKELEASELYCPNCKRAVPVRKFLLLILSDGDRYEYRCQLCGAKVGEKIVRSGQFYDTLKT
ncbi:MAG: cytoplasmic protein [Deltaproteobacteria bacterium]|nr:cytoplasmic protein [Deltaproteobacteria bacterium]